MSNEREPSSIVSPRVDSSEIDENLIRDVLRSARGLVVKMTGNTEKAEDLAQLALAKYLQLDESKRQEIKNRLAYLYRLMQHELLNEIRKERSHLIDSTASLSDETLGPSSASSAESVEVAVLLREIWRKINVEDRRLLELINFGYSSTEIAQRLDISEDAARQRISRLKNKVKAILVEKEYLT
jgi:RNA polymerase sigma factor (sigma-70 family)